MGDKKEEKNLRRIERKMPTLDKEIILTLKKPVSLLFSSPFFFLLLILCILFLIANALITSLERVPLPQKKNSETKKIFFIIKLVGLSFTKALVKTNIKVSRRISVA